MPSPDPLGSWVLDRIHKIIVYYEDFNDKSADDLLRRINCAFLHFKCKARFNSERVSLSIIYKEIRDNAVQFDRFFENEMVDTK